ncbi:NADPH:quinone reductase-like Zn-dependent oxidoreductase [Nitrospirillum amazonense]|uniref:NADPH:quinone reductase-like Zn-dependent oxidoreductase n=1 Tax=Nitrospirillum amazonense TaxID=28077 RepID=A0A560ETT7_9PROT|nr:zinc-dependent alcohol dehydrogenase family protein [Nitrospirillum amazonense]TWB12792.1 NADPH:quinone reductase-like Zn-dependent oxidoreductase [Nitrospirillum amazonense]
MPRVVTFTQYGPPEVLKIIDSEIPAPGPDEIRIRVKAIGLNRAEAMWRTGNYVEPVKLPGRLGYECSGIVDAVGAAVTHLAVGDEVTTMAAFSMNDYGVYGELVLVPAKATVKKPASLSFEQATALWSTFVTPWGAFFERTPLMDRDTVLIPAASSGVGLGAIQVAKLTGAKVVALSRGSTKTAHLLEAGADHVIATEEQDLVAEVSRITGGKGATVAFDPVGGPTFSKLVEAMAAGGTIHVYGALSEQVTPLPMLPMVRKELLVRGYNIFGITKSAERQAKVAKFIFDNVAAGKLKIAIAGTFTLDEIVAAHRALEQNRHVGKLVVTV